MRFVVLAAPESWYLRDLTRAAGEDYRIIPAVFSSISAGGGASGPWFTAGEVSLNDAEAVIVRTMPPGSLEQVVFRMDALARLEAAGIVVVNAPRSIETAVDKYLTTARLEAAGLPVPRTVTCQDRDQALSAFDALGGDVVVKPLFGAEGRGIARLTDQAMAQRAFSLLADLRAVIYLQEYLPHFGHDLRLFVLGERVWGMRRINPLDWRTNVSRGARTEAYQPSPAEIDIALRAARAVQATIAGVDLLPCRDGRTVVLEVNAVPGWQALARTLDLDVARLVLDHVALMVNAKRPAPPLPSSGDDRPASEIRG